MALTVGFLAAACGGSSGTDQPVDGSMVGTPDGGSPDSGMLSDAGTPGTDGGGTLDAAGKDAAASDATVKTGTAPTLTMVNARQVGRAGADLRVDFTGADPDKDIASVQVQLFDSAMAQIGTDSILPLVTAITTAAPAGAASYVVSSDALTMVALGTHTDFATVKVTLLDARNNASATVDATVGKQPEIALGIACDATFVTNRCAAGLGCKGAAPNTKCSAGEPPTLTMVGYYNDDMGNDHVGPRIVMAGNDPDGDVKSYTMRFLDAAGQEIAINLNNDPTMLVSTFTGPLGATEGTTAFSFRYAPSADFLNTVAKVAIKVADSRAAASAEMITNVLAASAPTKASAAACDPRGFDYCKGTVIAPLVCATSGTTSKCTAVSTARMNACMTAMVLDPANGITSVRGSVTTTSLWDSPPGCAGGDAHAQPDAVVKLILAADAGTVTLSTDSNFTAFDTELYALQACTDTPAVFDPRTPGSMDLWCDDSQLASNGDVISPKAVLTLRNLTAGTYYIVVDSTAASDPGLQGSNWQVSVTVQ